MKKSKNNGNRITDVFYVVSVLFYVAAMLNFVNGDNTNMGLIWLSLGLTFLCSGTAFKVKSKKDNDDKNK